MALLSTCQALREYLLPLFITLSPADYCHTLEGYYIFATRSTDYYLHITSNKLKFIEKEGSYSPQKKISEVNKKKVKEGTWGMERKVRSPKKQQIVLVTDVFKNCDFVPDFEFNRYQPTGLAYTKHTKEKFQKHLDSYKQIYLRRKCGAAVVTPDAPCCHEAISDIARGIFDKIPRDYEGYNSLLLEMAVLVENLAQECMANAMTDIEIHEKIKENIRRISPDLSETLKKIVIL